MSIRLLRGALRAPLIFLDLFSLSIYELVNQLISLYAVKGNFMKEWRRILYWLATGAVSLLFAIPGSALLAGVAHFTVEMARLGYPGYFLTLFGLLKIIGAVTILAPGFARLKEWAYAGMVFDALFAAYSRSAIGDLLPQIILPLVIGALVLTSWALRPATRKL
jgi:hypothetical protein